jgi:hypothetical protein
LVGKINLRILWDLNIFHAGTIVGHVGEGNFHCILPVFEEDNVQMAAVWTFSAQIVKS